MVWPPETIQLEIFEEYHPSGFYTYVEGYPYPHQFREILDRIWDSTGIEGTFRLYSRGNGDPVLIFMGQVKNKIADWFLKNISKADVFVENDEGDERDPYYGQLIQNEVSTVFGFETLYSGRSPEY